MIGVKEPLGAIAIRKRKRGRPGGGYRMYRVRFIKVRNGVLRAGRWIPLARHWWQTNRGPVPAGMCVTHADGDTLNDDPGNYELMTHGQVALLHLAKDPAVYRRMVKSRGAAMADFNRLKATSGFFQRTLTQVWYPADTRQRVIYYAPSRKRNKAFLPWGIVYATPNGVVPADVEARLAELDLVAVRGTQLRDDPFASFGLAHLDRRAAHLAATRNTEFNQG